MIKFFRRIRQHLLSENKFGKYLMYAFGEIVLVVIGILIALSLNTAKVKKNNKVKISNILREIQQDLEKDISNSKTFFNNFMFVDSIQDIVLNKKYSFEDYEARKALTVGAAIRTFLIHTNGYDNLIRNMDIMPEEYRQLLPDLNQLYVTHSRHINVVNARLRETVYDHLDFRYNQPWSRDWNLRIPNKEAIDYFLNDERYKRYVLKYMFDRSQVLLLSTRFRIDALKTYWKIAILLDEEDRIPKTIRLINKDSITQNKLIGNYSLIDSIGGVFGKKVKIDKEDSHLNYRIISSDINPRITKLFWHKESIYFSEQTLIINFNKTDTLILSAHVYGKGIYVRD